MVYWKGTEYEMIPSIYNGAISGYLVDGRLRSTQPKGTYIKGHIATEDGILMIAGRRKKPFVAIFCILLAAALFVLWPRNETVYYQVTFNAQPLYMNEILYCDVVNESGIEVTVRFINDTDKSEIITLKPGDTLPYMFLDFVPNAILYNGIDEFPLEVQIE